MNGIALSPAAGPDTIIIRGERPRPRFRRPPGAGMQRRDSFAAAYLDCDRHPSAAPDCAIGKCDTPGCTRDAVKTEWADNRVRATCANCLGFGHPPHKRNTRAGRNAACPCGSGRKFKKCCIKPNA